MLQNGASKHRGEDIRSRQHPYQEENCPTFRSSQIKSKRSSSPLSSVKSMATKASVTLENDLRRYGSFLIQNSTPQQQNTNENTSKQQLHSRQLRPSVLRKGNQPFPQEPEKEQSDFAPFYNGQSESRSKASGSSPQPSSTEHTGRNAYSVQEDLLCVKGQCRWPGCSKSKEVFKEYAHFLRHLSNEHAPGDRSIAQLRMQKEKVQHMENQLTSERQKLQAMHLHLFQAKSSSEVSTSVDKQGHLSGHLQPAVCQNANGLYDTEQVASDALAQGYWQISTSQVIPGIIPSFEYYKYTNIRPPFTYASMIRWAILETPEKQLTLNEIYHWFTRMFFYFRHNTATWKGPGYGLDDTFSPVPYDSTRGILPDVRDSG
ncbi:P3 Forkhead box protein [Triplophysa tibetana]|uniref:P3 Forkhead box protein n=1 Tax=Triplophysa tibetana TaxID=1572043 RepID=A0A5A9NW15_9TELE|nr:P3 Forkhead box protein [Triplophysa tibetana]